ncbi:DUF6141 family protein [Xanthocytophaga flava]|uniref:DUF6141 family protein n=1 Tax=Xanthocytophaga flava TaxID=3048013 RepID=UPI0028D82D79|nr:DUF6141 family protein [Xanthocytophaga flavus]MDJ1473280.1 DUF6141 family protein [Xanthocytophaga flavus]
MNDYLFFERQKFRQALVWILLIPINIFFIYSLVSQLIFHSEVGTKPMGNIALIFSSILVFVVSALFIIMRLDTIIREDGIYYKFFPFHKEFRKIDWKEIKDIYLRKYNPITEYGGWGPKRGPSGRAFNVSGNQGLQLILNDGNKVLLGTQKSDDLTQVLNRLNSTRKNT